MKFRFETIVFTGLLLMLNLPLLTGNFSTQFILLPDRVLEGEWWRLLTFVWVHNSLYHLIMDASAFLLLYAGLRAPTPARLLQLAACVLFSGLVPWGMDDQVKSIGLCGLSGVAHGLMIISAFEILAGGTKSDQVAGSLMLIGVLGKAIYEQITGTVLFAQWHLGFVGVPIPSCHFGGVIGGLLAVLFSTRWLPLPWKTDRASGDQTAKLIFPR
jgi:rhomboid family GlyGly-CTERM serine protease